MALTEEDVRRIIREELASFAKAVETEAGGSDVHYGEYYRTAGEGSEAIENVFSELFRQYSSD